MVTCATAVLMLSRVSVTVFNTFWPSDRCSGDDENRPMPQLKVMFIDLIKCHLLHRNSATEASSRDDGSGGHHFLAQGRRYLVERADR